MCILVPPCFAQFVFEMPKPLESICFHRKWKKNLFCWSRDFNLKPSGVFICTSHQRADTIKPFYGCNFFCNFVKSQCQTFSPESSICGQGHARLHSKALYVPTPKRPSNKEVYAKYQSLWCWCANVYILVSPCSIWFWN